MMGFGCRSVRRPSMRPPSGSPATTCRSAEPSSQDSRSTRSGSMAPIASRSARLPAALAASRQRSSTGDRSPVAAVIGVSSWPAACRKISSLQVTRAAPVETNAASGGCSPPRPIISASAAACGVRRSPSLSMCRRSSTYRMSRSCPVVARSCSSRGVVSRTGRERPRAVGDHTAPAAPARAGNCHGPRRRIRVMIGSPAR